MEWRRLDEREASTLAEARLGGSLLAAVIAAAFLCAVSVAGISLAFDRLHDIGLGYTFAVALVTVWSFLFVVMTVFRLRQTPFVTSVGLMAWIAYRLCIVLADGAVLHWPLLVDLLGEVLLGVGFCGYMAMAVRPNAYYRRRLPTA